MRQNAERYTVWKELKLYTSTNGTSPFFALSFGKQYISLHRRQCCCPFCFWSMPRGWKEMSGGFASLFELPLCPQFFASDRLLPSTTEVSWSLRQKWRSSTLTARTHHRLPQQPGEAKATGTLPSSKLQKDAHPPTSQKQDSFLPLPVTLREHVQDHDLLPRDYLMPTAHMMVFSPCSGGTQSLT